MEPNNEITSQYITITFTYSINYLDKLTFKLEKYDTYNSDLSCDYQTDDSSKKMLFALYQILIR